MNIEKVKNKIKKYEGERLNFKFNGSRNQVEEFVGEVVEIYSSIFIVRVADSTTIKSFSYSDILIKKLIVIGA